MKRNNFMNKICLFSLGLSSLILGSEQDHLKEKWQSLKESFVLEFSIAAPQVSAIPIQENYDPLIDLEELDNPRIRSIFTFPEGQAMLKWKFDEYSKVRKGLADSLVQMLSFLPDTIGIAYFEGYRPLSRQMTYFTGKYNEFRKNAKENGLSPEEAYAEISKYVSPFIQNVPPHCTGAAIDMTLFKIEGEQAESLMDLGQFGTIFGPNDQSHTFCETISPEQQEKRMVLLEAAKQADLVNYGCEWWHYSHRDQAYALVKNDSAVYGLISLDTSPYSSREEFIKDMEEKKA